MIANSFNNYFLAIANKIIKSLKTKNSDGYDEMSVKILK